MADNNSFEQWETEGALRTEERASKMVKEMLSSYQGPEMDVAKDEELLAFIVQKKSSFPDSNI
jgi:trimethylamine--corrinoid protein Co-methyltransferase